MLKLDCQKFRFDLFLILGPKIFPYYSSSLKALSMIVIIR